MSSITKGLCYSLFPTLAGSQPCSQEPRPGRVSVGTHCLPEARQGQICSEPSPWGQKDKAQELRCGRGRRVDEATSSLQSWVGGWDVPPGTDSVNTESTQHQVPLQELMVPFGTSNYSVASLITEQSRRPWPKPSQQLPMEADFSCSLASPS